MSFQGVSAALSASGVPTADQMSARRVISTAVVGMVVADTVGHLQATGLLLPTVEALAGSQQLPPLARRPVLTLSTSHELSRRRCARC